MELAEALAEADAWSTVEGFDETDNGDRAVLALRVLAAHLEDLQRGLASARRRADDAEAAIYRVRRALDPPTP